MKRFQFYSMSLLDLGSENYRWCQIKMRLCMEIPSSAPIAQQRARVLYHQSTQGPMLWDNEWVSPSLVL